MSEHDFILDQQDRRDTLALMDAQELKIADLEDAVGILRAACDEKDAEIARLKQDVGRLNVDNYVISSRRRKAFDRATRAEARLAAMATVTEADVRQAVQILASATYENWVSDVRAAIEAFVANKTAGAGRTADPWQPIATAPKKTKVFVRCGPTLDVAYQTSYGPPFKDNWRHAGSADNGRQLGYWPTHWMPAAPSLQRQEAGE